MSYRKLFIRLFCFLAIVYVIACTWVYFKQEDLLFQPQKLSENHRFSFKSAYEELTIPVSGRKKVNVVLFKAPVLSDRLIFFLHGNAGSMEDQEGVAKFYTNAGFDFMTFDYRGFGKSTGHIKSEKQFLGDAQLVYEEAKKRYREENIIIVGYSVGTCAATWLAARNHPAKLGLMAPYHSISDLATYHYKIIPKFILKYRFETFLYLPRIQVPVCLFHGKNDETIPYNSSRRLAGLLKKDDWFIPLEHQGHGGFEEHPVFKREMIRFLNQRETN